MCALLRAMGRAPLAPPRRARGPRLLAALCLRAAAAAAAVERYSHLEAQAFASLSQAAYCGRYAADEERLARWECGPCLDSGVRVVPGAVRVMESRDQRLDNATVTYVARADRRSILGDSCFVSIRGTTNVANWLRNFQAWKEPVHFPYDGCSGCKAEYGFTTIWNRVKPGILAALRELGCVPAHEAKGRSYLTGSVYVTGHSMGAAVGTLAMLTLAELGYRVRPSYLFESPRVGNEAFVQAFMRIFNNETKPMWRVTHAKDPVPDLPPRILQYRHVEYQVHYSADGTYRQCDIPFDPLCEEGLFDGLRHLTDHCNLSLTPSMTICGCYGGSESGAGSAMFV